MAIVHETNGDKRVCDGCGNQSASGVQTYEISTEGGSAAQTWDYCTSCAHNRHFDDVATPADESALPSEEAVASA